MQRARDPLAPLPPEPTPTRRDSVEIVESIVRAAVEIGDPDASINAIAEKAGVGVASVYRYFTNKGAIYAEVSRRLQREFLVSLRAILADRSLPLEQAVEACCRVAVELPGVTPALRRALNLSLPLSWTRQNADTVFSSALKEITEWLAARLDPPPPDLGDRVFVAFAAGRGLVMMSRLLPDIAPSDEVLIQQMVRGTLAYLREPAGMTEAC